MSTRTKYLDAYRIHKNSGTSRNFSTRWNPEKSKRNFKSLVSYMHANPLRVNKNLYRGMTTSFLRKLIHNGYLNNNRLTSFTKTKRIAENFSNQYQNNINISLKRKVLILKPGRYPAINNLKYNKTYNNSAYGREDEVTLAPGRYTFAGFTPNGNIKVNYTPSRLNQSLRL